MTPTYRWGERQRGMFYRLRVGEGGVVGVGHGVQILPGDLVYGAISEPLEGEAEAEDDVVGARYSQRAVGLVDTPVIPLVVDLPEGPSSE